MKAENHERHGDALAYATGSPVERVLLLCERLASGSAPVLIAGEDGSGREALARHLHGRSARAGKGFVPIDCAVLPAPILETELFGRVSGVHGPEHLGRVAMADGGTLYLEEVDALHGPGQLKLLRLLDEGRYEPVDSAQARAVDLRVIAATGADLPALVEAGLFRRDLFYALCAQTLSMPPLRERPGDVKTVFERLWKRREPAREVAPEVVAALEAHSWPGNVRELENLVERLSVCTDGPQITLDSLPAGGLFRAYPVPQRCADDARPPLELFEPKATPSGGPIRFPLDLQSVMKATEDRYLDAALDAAKGNRKVAAELLGLHRTTLVEKLRRRQASTPQYEEKPA